MYSLINSDDRRIHNLLALAAWILLLGCLAYNIYLVWATPNPGITFDARWEILALDACDAGPETCPNVADLQPRDRLVSVGELTYSDYVQDPSQVPFEGYLPGDYVPLTVLRDGQTVDVEWRVQPVETASIIDVAVVSLLVYGSFWLAGTFVLLYMRPADTTWVLLTSLFYLTTIWLAVGLYTQSNVADSALVLRAIGWLIAPVMVHLHLVVPKSRLDRRLRIPVLLMYALAILLLTLQLAGLVPWFTYLGGILIGASFSISLLTYRVLTPRSPVEKITARLMLAGIVLALVPGLMLVAIPLLLDIGRTDAIGNAISTLALPMLPFFYTYAIYKHRLGGRERRVNRLLVQYALVLLYFILLTLVFVVISNWLSTANAFLAIVVLIGLSVAVALLPIRRPVETVFDRLTYGTRYSHREILADFAERIPAAIDAQELVHLLKYELAPELEIRQSALLVRQGEQTRPLYSQGVGRDDVLSSWDEISFLLRHAEDPTTASDLNCSASISRFAWVQLAIPLRVKHRPNGAWLFGRRETEDMYSQEDIDLLDRLSGLIAVTLESSQLLEALSNELETRKQAEARLAQQSQRLRLLHEIDRAVLAAGSPVEIAQSAFNWLSQLVPCVRVSVFIFNRDLETMTILATHGSGGDLISSNDTFPFSAVPALDLLLDGQLYIENDMAQLASVSSLANSLEPAGVRAVVSVPLMASGSSFGALSVANDQPASFTPAHVATIEEVATSIALAIHNARLREEVSKSSQELRALSARLIDAQETERKRLSHELHDEMGQLLTAISLKLASVERSLPAASDGALKVQLADANDFVLELTNQVRSLSLELRPSMLHDLGLVSTLRWQVANYTKRNKTEINFEASNLPEHLPETIEITAYRVVQEALTNSSRHSGATQVDLTVQSANGCIQVIVEDNGRGFDLEAIAATKPTPTGIGLAMMRERIAAVNGRLDISTGPGKGTRIAAEIPIEADV